MIKNLLKVISSLIILAIVLVAMVEVFPEQMRQLESKAWFEFVDTIENSLEELKTKIHNATTLEQQRGIKEIVNDEITE